MDICMKFEPSARTRNYTYSNQPNCKSSKLCDRAINNIVMSNLCICAFMWCTAGSSELGQVQCSRFMWCGIIFKQVQTQTTDSDSYEASPPVANFIPLIHQSTWQGCMDQSILMMAGHQNIIHTQFPSNG